MYVCRIQQQQQQQRRAEEEEKGTERRLPNGFSMGTDMFVFALNFLAH